MRRAFAIFLTLFFGLGPLAALSGAADDLRLPACCRRHGTHHCSMSEDTSSRSGRDSAGTTHVFSAPSHCPMFPRGTLAPSTSTHALAAQSVHSGVLPTTSYLLIEHRLAPANHRARTLCVRGPPAPAVA